MLQDHAQRLAELGHVAFAQGTVDKITARLAWAKHMVEADEFSTSRLYAKEIHASCPVGVDGWLADSRLDAITMSAQMLSVLGGLCLGTAWTQYLAFKNN
jgi:hypothetical protein